MPVFGPGGDVVAAIELAVHDLAKDLQPVMAALAIASRSLSREIRNQMPTTPITPRAHRVPVAVGQVLT
jgi:hypothetical protein